MERIFAPGNNPPGILADIDPGDSEYNNYLVKALIADTVEYEETYQARDREIAQRYYDGLEPALNVPAEDPIFGDPPLDDETNDDGRSTIVSTDVRDTVLSILPSLMRIFASSEHSVYYEPNNAASVDMAAQATDYIRYKFWHTNRGFMTLYETLKTALIDRVGVITWYSDFSYEIKEERFNNVNPLHIGMILDERPGEAELINAGQLNHATRLLDGVVIRYKKSTPQLIIEGVPPEEFRISRNSPADIRKADVVGREEYIRASELISRGFDRDVVYEYIGADQTAYSDEQFLRNPGFQAYSIGNDTVQYGKYLVRYDSDGDGINELHCVHTLGSAYDIIEDYIVSEVNFAVFSPDIRPYSARGESITDIVSDLQRIKTNLIRGGLDSLAQSIFPRTAINELMVNVEDALNDDIGAVIRTRGDPQNAVFPITQAFVGKDAIDMAGYIDGMRQSRTGISEASKGVDPKAMQSTNLMGIDAIVTGAQERIELIARIFAETGLVPMYEGLLREVINNPNPGEMMKLNGDFVPVDPSTFDPSMRCQVNPMLGKGSDITRLSVLGNVYAQQKEIFTTYGPNNGVVGIQEMMNTITDMLALNNIKNTSRYFKQLTPTQIKAIESAPRTPTPEEITAQSLQDKNKTDAAIAVGKQNQETIKQSHAIAKDNADRQWAKEKTAIEAFVSLATLAKEAAAEADANVTAYVEPREK